MSTPETRKSSEHGLAKYYPSGGWKRALARAPMVLWRMGWTPLLGKFWLCLTTRGRKSGQPRHALLEYHPLGDRIYVPSGFGNRAQWFKNLVADPTVTAETEGGPRSMRATRVESEEEMREVYELIQRRNPFFFFPYLKGFGIQADDVEDVLAHRDCLYIVRLEPCDQTGPEPMAKDLLWGNLAAAGALGLMAAWWFRR